MQKLLVDKTNHKIISLVGEFINQSKRNIFWITGQTGYGKTAIVNYLIAMLKERNQRVCSLTSENLINLLVEAAKNQYPREWTLSHFGGYDLLVFDNIDLFLNHKPYTQESVRRLLQEISKIGKAKIILITSVSRDKLKGLKFKRNEIYVARLKKPTIDFKVKLLKQYIKESKINVSPEIIHHTARMADNLFQLKGAFYGL